MIRNEIYQEAGAVVIAEKEMVKLGKEVLAAVILLIKVVVVVQVEVIVQNILIQNINI